MDVGKLQFFNDSYRWYTAMLGFYLDAIGCMGMMAQNS